MGPIETYIRQSATARGINPNVAVNVARHEGGLSNPTQQSKVVKHGKRETSYGPFQLRIGGGVGDRALRAGIDPRREADWQRGVDFALNYVVQHGWGEWYGARAAGLSNFAGITRDSRPVAVTGGSAPAVAAASTVAPIAAATPAATGVPIAPGYVVPPDTAADYFASQGSTDTLVGSAQMPAALPPTGTLTVADLNASNAGLADRQEKDRVAQSYANIPWEALPSFTQQELLYKMGSAAPQAYETMRASLQPTFIAGGGATDVLGGSDRAPPADTLDSGYYVQPFAPGGRGPTFGVGIPSQSFPDRFVDMGAGTFAGGNGVTPSPAQIGGGSPLSGDVHAMFFAPPEQALFHGQPVAGGATSGIVPLQPHVTAPVSYNPLPSYPVQPYSTQPPAAGGPAMGGYTPPPAAALPVAPSDAISPMQMALQGVPGEMSQMPAAQQPTLGDVPVKQVLAHPAVQGVVAAVTDFVKGIIPNGVHLPTMQQMTGITGFGGGPLPAGVNNQAGFSSFLGAQQWHNPSFNATSGGPTYQYFTPAQPGGIGGYKTSSGKVYTYPTDSDIYHSVAS